MWSEGRDQLVVVGGGVGVGEDGCGRMEEKMRGRGVREGDRGRLWDGSERNVGRGEKGRGKGETR